MRVGGWGVGGLVEANTPTGTHLFGMYNVLNSRGGQSGRYLYIGIENLSQYKGHKKLRRTILGHGIWK